MSCQLKIFISDRICNASYFVNTKTWVKLLTVIMVMHGWKTGHIWRIWLFLHGLTLKVYHRPCGYECMSVPMSNLVMTMSVSALYIHVNVFLSSWAKVNPAVPPIIFLLLGLSWSTIGQENLIFFYLFLTKQTRYWCQLH